MNNQPKYKLVEATEEEKSNFMKDFNDILVKHSIYFEPVPQFTRETLNDPWKVVCQVLIQKKVEIVEVEKDSIPSPFADSADESSPKA
jgi:hypothetical protein